jgi:histidyl-tRNA synthetase
MKARFCLLLGPEEIEGQTMVLKDMHSGQQRTIPQAELPAALDQAWQS